MWSSPAGASPPALWAPSSETFRGSAISWAAWWIFSLFLNVAFLAAAARATIYQNFKAGYRAKTLWQMVSRDPWGLVKIFVINLVAGLIVGIVTIMVFMPALFGSLGFIVDLADYMNGYYYYMTEAEEMRLALEVLGFFVQQFAPAFFATLLVSLVAGSFVGLLINCGIGLWLRQFDVPAWGKDEDPLPETSVVETSVSELPAESRGRAARARGSCGAREPLA